MRSIPFHICVQCVRKFVIVLLLGNYFFFFTINYRQKLDRINGLIETGASVMTELPSVPNTRWFKYDRDKL
jgi:hypothetical protein